MHARTARLGVLTAAVVGLMVTMVPSASATTIKEVGFTGNANLARPLGYPCAPITVPPTFTKCPPPVGTMNHADFTFRSDNCVKLSVSANKTPDKTGPAFCHLVARGTVWGYCGLSVGLGTATLVNTGPIAPEAPGGNKTTMNFNFEFTGVASTLFLTGTQLGGNAFVTGEAFIFPAAGPLVGSCTDKTATTFTLAAKATITDLTP